MRIHRFKSILIITFAVCGMAVTAFADTTPGICELTTLSHANDSPFIEVIKNVETTLCGLSAQSSIAPKTTVTLSFKQVPVNGDKDINAPSFSAENIDASVFHFFSLYSKKDISPDEFTIAPKYALLDTSYTPSFRVIGKPQLQFRAGCVRIGTKSADLGKPPFPIIVESMVMTHLQWTDPLCTPSAFVVLASNSHLKTTYLKANSGGPGVLLTNPNDTKFTSVVSSTASANDYTYHTVLENVLMDQSTGASSTNALFARAGVRIPLNTDVRLKRVIIGFSADPLQLHTPIQYVDASGKPVASPVASPTGLKLVKQNGTLALKGTIGKDIVRIEAYRLPKASVYDDFWRKYIRVDGTLDWTAMKDTGAFVEWKRPATNDAPKDPIPPCSNPIPDGQTVVCESSGGQLFSCYGSTGESYDMCFAYNPLPPNPQPIDFQIDTLPLFTSGELSQCEWDNCTKGETTGHCDFGRGYAVTAFDAKGQPSAIVVTDSYGDIKNDYVAIRNGCKPEGAVPTTPKVITNADCAWNQQVQNNVCVTLACSKDAIIKDHACHACPDYQTAQGNECVMKMCPAGQELNGNGTCVAITCGTGEILSAGLCKCDAANGYSKEFGSWSCVNNDDDEGDDDNDEEDDDTDDEDDDDTDDTDDDFTCGPGMVLFGVYGCIPQAPCPPGTLRNSPYGACTPTGGFGQTVLFPTNPVISAQPRTNKSSGGCSLIP